MDEPETSRKEWTDRGEAGVPGKDGARLGFSPGGGEPLPWAHGGLRPRGKPAAARQEEESARDPLLPHAKLGKGDKPGSAPGRSGAGAGAAVQAEVAGVGCPFLFCFRRRCWRGPQGLSHARYMLCP